MSRGTRINLVVALFTVACTNASTSRQSVADSSLKRVTIDSSEHARTIEALKPPKRQRPVVAILAANIGTETTDFLVPHGVLSRADVADVWALAMQPGHVALHPALTIEPRATIAQFDSQFPDGSDYVIVPAMHMPHDSAVLAWVVSQQQKGVIIVGVCSGARILSNAGLLRNRAATGHWYDIDWLQKQNPSMRWVRDRRYVVDRGVATTTGVSASVPISLALVEAIAGRAAATTVAHDLGLNTWDESHDSDVFQRRWFLYRNVARNWMTFWGKTTVGILLENGVDDVALALTADPYARSYRSRVVAIAPNASAIRTRSGLVVVPDRVASVPGTDLTLVRVAAGAPARALDSALAGITKKYGLRTAALVALQLEYVQQASQSNR